ncbi:reverse transcriptase/maturase family protein [Legionella pneumophila]|uniref:reverse transcriptase/maturase family protein n=1 Tax=Legionella pneumophila TaxID=446 RepID=UPI00077081DF|nr:reverse transcriptase/maturase family protein [Legionella pneumophila]CZG67500.1 Group II intron-encoded protein ltrA [Legionella pneumophila]CZG72040.1 Group II intron-encoded protein ltrA [Legionella pneumophila]CZG89995.1 Group II intron-encoded protein ltrA [Legionella pneumophila]
MQKGRGTKWFIEGDLCACFDTIDHDVLISILKENFQDNRFIRLMHLLLKAGYLENWKYNATYSGVPQGSIVGPVLSNLLLDRLDQFVEQKLIPENNRSRQRKTNPEYGKLTVQLSEMRKRGEWESARLLRQQVQKIPSKTPDDPNYRCLWYVRYADDFLLGLAGSKNEAEKIKDSISAFLKDELKLTLNQDKTLVTHARDGEAKFLGYEIHVLHADDKHDQRAQRCINGSIGLCIPHRVKQDKCARYMCGEKPIHLPQRTIDTAYRGSVEEPPKVLVLS